MNLRNELEEKTEYRKYLYSRGYLITTNEDIDLDAYPFYSDWTVRKVGKFCFYIKNGQHLYILENGEETFFIVGHAYNPFTMEKSEDGILLEISSAVRENRLFEKINELTGNFLFGLINKGELTFLSDPSCMLVCYYGVCGGNVYLSQYSQLIGDICNLEQSEYVKRLVSSRFYSLFGRMLPGDMSPYDKFRHTVPNFVYTLNSDGSFTHRRFYPVEKLEQGEEISGERYCEIVDASAKILRGNLELISGKWKIPAISMTGGCDSKTTLSCANGLYDRFIYYSHISSEAEAVDAKAAEKICKNLNLEHKTDFIPEKDEDVADIEIWREILRTNCGNIGANNRNDVRKRAYYAENHYFDVEIKSWVSEVVRAYFSKRFDCYKFPEKPYPRIMTAMYKVFFGDRKLLRETDKIFEKFLGEYGSDEVFEKINWVDLFFWEFRVSSWNGPVISNEHTLSYDIAIPYNNRILIEKMLSLPLEYRISDKCHKDIQKKMNEKIYDMGISVTNLKHTDKRAKAEKLYLIFRKM